jgi:prolyl-tRNA synthetase
MSHGDDAGLRLPPRLAPVQAVVVVARAGEGVEQAARTVADELRAQGVRVELDDRADVAFGRRAVDWELKGVPVRVDLGPRDLAEGRVPVVRRVPGDSGPVPLGGVVAAVRRALEEDQTRLLAEARARLAERTADVETADEALAAARDGWARIAWARLGPEGEARLAEHGVTVRCLVRPDGELPGSDDEPGTLAVVGRAY